jgi:hypothetical protein
MAIPWPPPTHIVLRRRLGGADHQDVRALPVRPSEMTGRTEGRAAAYTRSTSMAIPWPPPTHIVSRPIVPSSVSRSFSSVHMIRAPVMP